MIFFEICGVLKMDKNRTIFKGGLLGEHILYGIFVGIAVFWAIKYLGGWNVANLSEIVALTFLVSIISGVVVAGLFSYFLSRRSVKSYALKIEAGMVRYLQQKNTLPLEYKSGALPDSKAATDKIYSILGHLSDRIIAVNRIEKECEETIARYTDMRGMSMLQLNNTKGEVKDVTVLFTDIKNFNEFYQNMSSEEVMRFLNVYISTVTNIVHNRKGVVNKIIGDETMSVFEAKTGDDKEMSHEFRAVDAALEICKSFDSILAEANIRIVTPMKIAFGVGVGVNSGPAIVGTIGSKERMEYTVLGDTVELAGLVALNADIGVTLITEDTYQRIGKRLVVIEPAPVSIGKNKGFCRVYIVKGVNLIIRQTETI